MALPAPAPQGGLQHPGLCGAEIHGAALDVAALRGGEARHRGNQRGRGEAHLRLAGGADGRRCHSDTGTLAGRWTGAVVRVLAVRSAAAGECAPCSSERTERSFELMPSAPLLTLRVLNRFEFPFAGPWPDPSHESLPRACRG